MNKRFVQIMSEAEFGYSITSHWTYEFNVMWDDILWRLLSPEAMSSYHSVIVVRAAQKLESNSTVHSKAG